MSSFDSVYYKLPTTNYQLTHVAETTPPKNTLPLRSRTPEQNLNSPSENKNTAAQEESYQYSLAENRASRKEDQEVENLARFTSPPSGLVYGAAFFIAISGDIIDVVLTFIPGIGWLAGMAIDLLFDGPLILLGFRVKKGMAAINDRGGTVAAKIELIEQKVNLYRQRYAMLLKFSRKSKVLRKPVRQLALKIKNSKARKFLTKNPIAKWIAGAALDEIPIIDLIPWRTLAIYTTHKQHKRAYAEFLSLFPEYEAARSIEAAELNQMLELEAMELTGENLSDESKLAA